MKVPGLVEYRYAMPRAAPGDFPVNESLWMSDSWQQERNLDQEQGGIVVWYGPGSWNRGPAGASAQLRVACVDHLFEAPEAKNLYYIGVPKERFPLLASTSIQRDAMWCWAAVAQMILALQGRAMRQEDIVARALGDVSGSGVSSAQLAQGLQRVGIQAIEDRLIPKQGVQFQTSTDGKTWKPMKAYNPLGDTGEADNVDSRQLALELLDGMVYIMAYGTGENRAHAVLLVGVDVTVTPEDFKYFSRFEIWRVVHKITIKKYHVINPWPGKGYQVLSPDQLQEVVKWRVKA